MEYNSLQAALRLRRVQQLCKQHGLDGVLLVPGLDSRYSVCNQAVGYLLEGRSNRDTIDVVKLEDQLDEVLALVTDSIVCLYAPTPELHDQLQELLLPHVPSLRLLGPTTTEIADPDQLEENKVASFVHLLRGCKRVGIPCGLGSASPHNPSHVGASSNGGAAHAGLPHLVAAAQLLELEKWPLVQAYGLEGVGRSGFFTMNFDTYDMQPALQHLYGELDGRSLAVLLSEGVPTLRQHWDEMVQALGGKPAGQRGGLSEKQVVEPLAGYFAYGLLRPVPGVQQAVILPPRAIFGPRSSDDSAVSEAAPLAHCGPSSDRPPLHLVVEAADPRSPLRVARTYFLSRGVAERNVFADRDEEAEQGYSFDAATANFGAVAEDVVALMRLYAALMEAARAAMTHFATVEGATALTAKAQAQEVLARRAEQLGAAGLGTGGGQALAGRLRFALWQCDHANHVTAPAVRGSRQLKVLRLSLPDIPSRSSGPLAGKSLGGLVYGDTFLDLPGAPFSTGAEHAGGAGVPQLLVLTEAVPVLLAVPAGGCEEDLAARALRSLGRVVESLAGPQSTRAAHLASQRDLERRAAVAAAESQAVAARMRALRAGSSVEAGDEEEAEEDGEERVAAAAATTSAAATVGGARVPPEEALGRLLTLGGGDEAVLLTGAAPCAALSGTLYCFSAGLVFVEAASRAVWTLDIREPHGLEAVTMQQLPPAASSYATVAAAATGNFTAPARAAAAGPGGGGEAGSLGEAVVFRGTAPACGLAPACHLTTNTHVALALAAMSPAARRFLIQTVLPAWQQTCRGAAVEARSGATSYLKDVAAPNPFPPGLHAVHAYAIQSSSAGGAAKTWSALTAEDGAVEGLLGRLDQLELEGPLSGLDPRIEALLLQEPPQQHPAAPTSGSSGGALTLVVGLPGADQAAVAAAIATMLGDEASAHVALLPASPGPLRPADFETALSSAAGSTSTVRAVRHLVLATSSYTGLYDQLGMLAAAVGGAAGRWWLSSVVICVSADVVYEEPSRRALAGCLLSQLAPGFLDCVVIGGGDTARVTSLTQLVSERLPDVPQVRSGRSQLLRAREELLPKRGERTARLSAPAAVAARCWAPLAAAPASATGDRPGSLSGGLLGPLQASLVVFEGAIDVNRLRDALAELGVPQDPAAVPPLPLADTAHAAAAAAAVSGLVCVRGCVRVAPVSRAGELLGTRHSALRAREWPLAEAVVVAGAPRLPADEKLPGGELLFIGTGAAVQEPALRRLLARCAATAAGTPYPSSSSATAGIKKDPAAAGAGAAPAAGAVPRTAADLTPAQRAAIRQAHLFDPLPDGYCFNGTQYFDAFGDASMEHPDMDRFISEWLAEQQSKAAQAADRTRADGPSVLRVLGPVPL